MAKAERGFVATSSVEGAWVGTWRPHRPHGPIMAQFTSPGPKYSIPGTTGYLADNPTKAKAPAYTFQRAKPPAAESCSPGPRYYVQPRVTSNGKDVAPAQHMGGLPKLKTAVTPGPSDYSIDKASKHVYRSPPAQSLAFRHTALRADQAPGWSWTSTRNGLPRTPWEPKPDLEVTKRQSRGRQTTAWER